MAQVYSQAYGYNFYMQLILKDALNFSNLNIGGLGTGKFMNIATLSSNDADVVKVGTGSTLGIGLGTSKATTKAALASNVVTLTFAAAHGFTVAQTIVVSGFTGDFAGINGKFAVKAVTTSSPFTLTYDLTGTNITEASVVGSVLPALKLDGTDAPIRLLGLTNAAPQEGEGEETVITYDDEAKSFDTSIATSKNFSWTIEGVTDHDDAAYRLLRFASKESVREGLMVKYARRGPVGKNETTFGYGRITGFNETPPAGGIVKWSSGIKAYGPYELEF
ncbi:MAG: hypothetical protein VKK97_11505 [Synechococcaceae cyanobacterium]|nr:hypothetical protein [Synechococcaceae cyanobacterium]